MAKTTTSKTGNGFKNMSLNSKDKEALLRNQDEIRMGVH